MPPTPPHTPMPDEPPRDAREGRRASYREGLSYAALTFFVRAALGIGGSIIVARIYGIDVIGATALAMAPGLTLALLSTVREQAALVRELSVLPHRSPRGSGLFAAVLTFSSALTFVVAVIVSVITYHVYNGGFDHPELVWPAIVYISSYVLFENATWNMDTVFSSYRAGRELFHFRTGFAVAVPVFTIASGLVWPTVWSLVLATCAAKLVTVVHRLLFINRFLTLSIPAAEVRDGFRTLPSLIKFGLKLAPGRFADGASAQLGTWILGAIGPVSAVGAWSRANSLGRRLLEASNRINEMLLPTMVERDALGDRAGSDRSLIESLRYSTAGMMLLAAPAGGAGGAVMSLYGPGFDAAANAFAILMLLPALSTIQALLATSLIAKDRPALATYTSLGRLAATVVLSFALTLWLGVTGAALAVVLGLAASLAVMFPIIGRQLSTSFLALWPPRQIAALGLSYVGGFVAARLVSSAIPGVPGLVPATLAGMAAFAVLFVACGGVADRDRERFASIRRNLRGRRAARAGAA
jgi:O-antigen/teichoic acid export membrane protein